jgi:TolB-like protein
MKLRRTLIFALALVLLCTSWQCAGQGTGPVYTKDGKDYGKVQGAFRARWWNHYERALSYADGEFYQEALADLQEAVRQRERDQRMARTYGMHFVDYFPHRELGVIYYQQGNLSASQAELELSLSQYPSAKARFYLDRVRKRLLEQEGLEVTAPRLTFDFEAQEVWTREDPVVVSGVAEDDRYVAGITIKEVPLFLEGAEKRIPFEEQLDLAQGEHRIAVEARNLLGKSTRRELLIHVDREGPLVTLEELRVVQAPDRRELTISGSLYDEAGVADLSLNGERVPIRPGIEIPFTARLRVDRGEIVLVARDRLGNETSAQIPLETSPKDVGVQPGRASQSPPDKLSDTCAFWLPLPPLGERVRVRGMGATLHPLTFILSPSRGGEENVLAVLGQLASPHLLKGGEEPCALSDRFAPRKVLLASLDSDMALHLAAGLLGPGDTRPPDIQLKGWTDTQTVYVEKIYLEGRVTDESKIESVTINQVPILRRKGQSIFFSHLAELQEGENRITIEARDEAGNVARKTISVIRRVPKALQLAQRFSTTVLPFEQKGLVAEAGLAFRDHLIHNFVQQNRFRVIERDKLELILREQKISQSKLIDKATALQVGKLVASESIVTGSIVETRTGIEIVSRMIDTETSEILATEDVYGETVELGALMPLAEGMAVKFHRDFPLLTGLVVQCKGKDIFSDLGQEQVKVQRRLIVYREEPVKHPVTGKILGADTEILGRARVTQVLPDMSKAELLDGKAETVKRLDRVITE